MEDVELNRDLLVQLLEDDHEVTAATNGAAGLEAAARLRPDLILMDLSLPVIDGWEASRRLKADPAPRHIPVIALTAHAMQGDEARAPAAATTTWRSRSTRTCCSRRCAASWTAARRREPALRMADAPLMVDDEPMNVDLLEQELELLGYATISAGDGLAALERLAAHPVDLVLLDVMMPRLDGYQVLGRLKADPELRHVPVIMISALDQLESAVRGIELGAEDYLPKPFEPTLLKARIGACLEKKRWRDQEIAWRREIERERADRLLHAILPAPAVAELKASDRVTPRRYDEVAVLFADIVGFTRYCESHPAEAVVANLDRLIEAARRWSARTASRRSRPWATA